MVTKQEIWNISDDEAKKLALAIKNVLKHHSITINPVILAYAQLIGIAAAIYIPRLGILVLARKMQQEQMRRETELNAASQATTEMTASDPTSVH